MLSEIEFTSPVVDERGVIVEQQPGATRLWSEQIDSETVIEMLEVPGGSFRMGSLHGQGYADEEPQHFVQISSFWMGRFPVTQGQWQAVMGQHTGRFKGADLPVETISWEQSMRFCRNLSKKTSRHYALPSEAQWEYACRAGSPAAFSFGEMITSDLANYNGEFAYHNGPRGIYRHAPTVVGQFPPNAFGLHEMHGTLWEWCADAWHDDYRGAPADSSARGGGARPIYRAARGGCWHDIPEVCRSAARLRAKADEGDELMGLRVILLDFKPAVKQWRRQITESA